MTTESPQESVSVVAVIIDADGRCLVVRQTDNDEWEPPGGLLESGEGIEEGLRRNVREETGLDIELGPLTGMYKNRAQRMGAVVFRAAVAGGRAATHDEVADLRWVTPDEASALVADVHVVRVLDAYDKDGPYIRDHDGTKVTPSMTNWESE